MQICYFVILLIYLLLQNSAFAEERNSIELEPVVVTASKIEEPLSEITTSIEIVTTEDIKVKQLLTLDEALRPVSGLTIRTFGGADPWAGVNLRGTESNHSIIMIDGVKINPSYSQSPPAGALLLSNVERIEVVKGSYSALYGSEAIGGVVNVIMAEKPGLIYSIGGGTHRTFNSSIRYSGSYKETTYTLGYERLSTAGFEFSGPYWNNTFLGRINLPLSTISSLQLSTNYWNWKKYDHTICCEINGIDNFAFIIDKDSNSREDNWLNSIQLSHHPLDQWNYNVKLAMYDTDSHWTIPLDTPTADRPFPTELNSDIRSARDTFEMQHNIDLDKRDTATLGFQYSKEWVKKEEFGNLDSIGMGPSAEQADVKADRLSRAIYLQNLFKIRRLFTLAAGVRLENGPGYDNEIIPRVSALYVLPATRTRFNISYGRGIRAPSIEELYHPVGGNPDLNPEKSTSLEAGFKQPFVNERIWLEATGFALRLRDLIDWSSDPAVITFVNIGRSKITGAEANLRLAITEKLQNNIGYTRLITENIDTEEDLPFRPHYKWTAEIRYKPANRIVIDINAEFAGKSFNPFDFLTGLDGKPLSSKVDSYRVVNMAATYNILNGDPILGSLDFTLKVNNIFDEEYTVIPDFRNYRFTFLVGIRSTH